MNHERVHMCVRVCPYTKLSFCFTRRRPVHPVPVLILQAVDIRADSVVAMQKGKQETTC